MTRGRGAIVVWGHPAPHSGRQGPRCYVAPALSKLPRARLLLAVLYVALIAAVIASDIEPEQAREQLRASGFWGPLIFLGAFAALQPLGVASHVFIIAAALVWDPWLALPLSWAGAVIAGCVAFGFARFVGRSWVQEHIPKRLEGYDERLALRGFQTVFLLRLMFFTFGPLQLLFGVSKVRFVPFLLGSMLGLLPWIAIETLFGGSVIEWLLR